MLTKETTKKNLVISLILFVALGVASLLQPYFDRAYANCKRKWNDWRAKRKAINGAEIA